MWLACGAAFAAGGCSESHGAPGNSVTDATFRDDVPTEAEPAEASAPTSVDATTDTWVDTGPGLDVADVAVDTWVGQSPVLDAAVEASADSGPDLDANEVPNADGAVAALEGGFVCIPAGIQGDAAIVCNRNTQYCHLHSGNYTTPSACAELDPKCLAYPPIADASTCQYLASAPCDGGPLRCSCIATEPYSGFSGSCWQCSDDDAGGVTLSCGSCYGAPPADLARWRARDRATAIRA